jgi:DNA-binding SARP family transcriptional activator
MSNDNIWYIRLLGGLRAERGDDIVSRFRSQKIGALLAYLALFPQRAHAREELADLLWPDADPEAGRANLRGALASLRRQLEPPGTPAGSVLVAEGRQNISLQVGAADTDVQRFERALKAAGRQGVTSREQLRLLTEAANAYSGPLLPGFYETWALSERDRLAEAQGRVLRGCVYKVVG